MPDAVKPGTFHINYAGFIDMVGVGDQIFLGRYLVTGADESSLYLEVRNRDDVSASASKSLKLGLSRPVIYPGPSLWRPPAVAASDVPNNGGRADRSISRIERGAH